jgi:hypothetical protein
MVGSFLELREPIFGSRQGVMPFENPERNVTLDLERKSQTTGERCGNWEPCTTFHLNKLSDNCGNSRVCPSTLTPGCRTTRSPDNLAISSATVTSLTLEIAAAEFSRVV